MSGSHYFDFTGNMGKLTLYGLLPSSPVRAVLLTLKELNLPYEYVEVDLFNKQQLSAEFTKKNPQHTVPTLEDDGHFIWDSHAIIAYLVRKYAKNDALYPKDPLQRAVVDQRLHFESGVVFAAGLRITTKPLFFDGKTEIPKERIDAIVAIYDFVETFLQGHTYIAGDHLTLADFSLISSISSLVAFVEIDAKKYPKTSAWIALLEKLPYYEEANGIGNKQYIKAIKNTNFTIGQ